MSMYVKNHYNIVISLQLIKIIGEKLNKKKSSWHESLLLSQMAILHMTTRKSGSTELNFSRGHMVLALLLCMFTVFSCFFLKKKKKLSVSYICSLLVTQSCLILCDPTDCNLPGSSVYGILQVRIVEWVVIPGDLPNPGIKPESPTSQADSLLSEPSGFLRPPKISTIILLCCATVLTHSSEPSSLNSFHQASYSKTIWLIMGQMPTSYSTGAKKRCNR